MIIGAFRDCDKCGKSTMFNALNHIPEDDEEFFCSNCDEVQS
jgi:hypothetical protein